MQEMGKMLVCFGIKNEAFPFRMPSQLASDNLPSLLSSSTRFSMSPQASSMWMVSTCRSN
jgi:hypothetical protein